jgi:hypothetical protein
MPFPKLPSNAGSATRTSLVAGTKLIIGSPFWVEHETLKKKATRISQQIPLTILGNREEGIVNFDLFDDLKKPNKYHFVLLDSPEFWDIYEIKKESQNLYKMHFEKDINYVFVFGHELCGFNIYNPETLDCNPKIKDFTFIRWFRDTFPYSTYSYAYIPQSHSGKAFRKGEGITLNYGVVAAIDITIAIAASSGIFDTSLKYQLPK